MFIRPVVRYNEGVDETIANELVQTALLGEAIDAGPALIFVADEEMKYVAVNAFAATVLGYTRAELLALRVSDVAVPEEGAGRFEEMVSTGSLDGVSPIRRKDGVLLRFRYQARQTTVAGTAFFVSIGFLED